MLSGFLLYSYNQKPPACFAVPGVAVLFNSDAVAGANLGAFAAASALFGVNASKTVFYNDCVVFAFLLAATAADTGAHAAFAGNAGHIAVAAANDHFLRNRQKFDHGAGASIDTSAAGRAQIFVDVGNAINHGNGIKGAVVHTVAQTNAGEAASFGTTGNIGGNHAAAITVITAGFFGNALDAVAEHAGNLAFTGFHGNTHDLADLAGAFGTGRSATVGIGFAFHNSLSKSFTTGKAAGTAVCLTGASLYLFNAFIHFNVEFLAGEGENQTENQTKSAQTQGSIQNRHLSVLLTPYR